MEELTLAQIVLIIISAIATGVIARLGRKLDQKDKLREKKESEQDALQEAMKEGLQAMLRDRIIQMASFCQQQGHTQVYMVENMAHMFTAYTTLGGNGAAKYIYEQFMALPVMQEDKKE